MEYEIRYIERHVPLQVEERMHGLSETVLVLQQCILGIWEDVPTVKEDPNNE